MSKIIEWGDVDSGTKKASGGSGGSGAFDKFLKLKPGCVYTVRPIGNPCAFHAYWVSGGAGDAARFNRAITADPNNCIIRQKYNLEPKTRYAVNVIDRADGKLKVMEAPPSVFDKIKAWAKAAGQDPGGKHGIDFQIELAVPANGDKKRTEYKTTPIVQTPFTDEEKSMLKEKGLYDLEELYKAVPQDEIEEKLYGKVQAAPARTASAPQAVSAPVKARPSNNDVDLGF